MRNRFVLHLWGDATDEIKPKFFPSRKSALDHAVEEIRKGAYRWGEVCRRPAYRPVLTIYSGTGGIRFITLGRRPSLKARTMFLAKLGQFSAIIDARLCELGLTARKARLVRQTVVAAWKKAIQRREDVELPGGTLQVVGAPEEYRRWAAIRPGQKKRIHRLYKGDWRLRFRRDPRLDLPLIEPWPPNIPPNK